MLNAKITTGRQLAENAYIVATEYKTLYVRGCFGAPMTEANKQRYIEHYAYNAQANRKKAIEAATADTFGFDCSNMIKGLLWGWSGDLSKNYGGATYKLNDIPDLSANGIIQVCNDVSTDFSKIEVGEAVWTNGHIGVYIGGGLAVESTPRWADRVQITACNNEREGHNSRYWKKHGKLPYISYTGNEEDVQTAEFTLFMPDPKTIDELAHEVINGLWGTGSERKRRLTEAGYDYAAVQARVNEILHEAAAPWTPAVGDTVNFTGNRHYSSANAVTGPTCKPGLATITRIYKPSQSRHPYSLVRVKGGGSTVYGWVDEGTFTKA